MDGKRLPLRCIVVTNDCLCFIEEFGESGAPRAVMWYPLRNDCRMLPASTNSPLLSGRNSGGGIGNSGLGGRKKIMRTQSMPFMNFGAMKGIFVCVCVVSVGQLVLLYLYV